MVRVMAINQLLDVRSMSGIGQLLRLRVAVCVCVCMFSLTHGCGIHYTDMSQHAPAQHNKTRRLCMRRCRGDNGQLVFRGSQKDIQTPALLISYSLLLWFCKSQPVILWTINEEGAAQIWLHAWVYGSPRVLYVCVSVPALSDCQRLLIGRLMDWADPVACCVQPFVAEPARSWNAA